MFGKTSLASSLYEIVLRAHERVHHVISDMMVKAFIIYDCRFFFCTPDIKQRSHRIRCCVTSRGAARAPSCVLRRLRSNVLQYAATCRTTEEPMRQRELRTSSNLLTHDMTRSLHFVEQQVVQYQQKIKQLH